MVTVNYREASHIYPGSDRAAVDKLDLEIADGEFMVLVGPSGCGKSTPLRMPAGLEGVNSDSIFIGGRDVTDLPPKDRDIVMVFQNYVLHPYMTVVDNMGFALKMQNVPKAGREKQVEEAAHLLGLGDFLSRKPKALPGGQRQRIAMGRAIVRQSQVLPMDEPLSNLDAKPRVSTRIQTAALQRHLGVTTVYVTYDQVEAMTMGDRVAVMRDGVLQQVDSPLVLYDTPKNLFVTDFISSPAMNLIEGVVADDGVQIGDYVVPMAYKIPVKVGGEAILTLGICFESLRIATDGQGIGLDIAAVEGLGADSYPYGTLAGLSEDEFVGAQQIVARAGACQAPIKDDVVRLAADPESVHVFSNVT